MYDRKAAFEAFFKRVEDGYIFYPHRFARGISVTESEHDRMVEAYEDLNSGKALAAFLIMIAAMGILGIVAAFAFFRGGSPVLAAFFIAVIATAFMVLLWLRGRAIREPILGRKPDQPRRDGREFDIALGRANIWLMWLFVVVAGLQIFLNAERAIEDRSTVSAALTVFFAVGFLFFLRIIYRTWRADREERV